MMKKLVSLLLALCLLLPAMALGEGGFPENRRAEEFDDFTLPVAPNAILYRCEPDEDDRRVAELIYLDIMDPAFQPFMVIWWFPNNMSAYYNRLHPLNYGRSLTDNIVADLRESGCTVTDPTTVYGMRKGSIFYTLCSMHIAQDSIYADEAHDLWVYQRYYGTYEMGTYFFEIYAPSREHIEAIIPDLEAVVFK